MRCSACCPNPTPLVAPIALRAVALRPLAETTDIRLLSAVRMAEMCAQRATHLALRNLCADILPPSPRTSPDAGLTVGRAQHPQRAAGAAGPQQWMQCQARNLRPTAFEVWLASYLIRHYRQTIPEAGSGLDRAFHPDPRPLC